MDLEKIGQWVRAELDAIGAAPVSFTVAVIAVGGVIYWVLQRVNREKIEAKDSTIQLLQQTVDFHKEQARAHKERLEQTGDSKQAREDLVSDLPDLVRSTLVEVIREGRLAVKKAPESEQEVLVSAATTVLSDTGAVEIERETESQIIYVKPKWASLEGRPPRVVVTGDDDDD